MRTLDKVALVLIPLGFVASLLPWTSPAMALAMGLALALTCGNPHLARTRKLVRPMLAYSIVGLGAGMNLLVVARAGLNGIAFTALSLTLTLAIGWLLGKLLKTPPMISLLINVGTAICGGSAIAAVSAAVHADEDDTSLALAVIFILNACGLLIFPSLGHALNLTQHQFGVWGAIAIHDTSSVVGATMQYGAEALETGTTIKLVRSLWIIPVTLIVGRFYRNTRTGTAKPKYPLFIVGFLIASAIVTWIPVLREPGHIVEFCAKRALAATLFLIGASLTVATLRKVGLRPLVQGVVLWVIVAVCSLLVVRAAS